MSLIINELSPRQRRVLQKLAEGLPAAEIAKDSGYSKEHISRLHRSEIGQAELIRIREQIEAKLAAELPELISQALIILKDQLSHPVQNYRAAAAQFVLKNLATPFVKALAANEAANGIVIQNGILTTGQGGQNYENTNHD